MTTQANSQTNTVTLTIDGVAVTVPKGTTVYQATQQLGIHVPIFCYQDRMPPFGACRVCLVEVDKMPKLQTSCTLEATEGMVVNTQSPKAVDGRKGILEFLLINHPLDCPICDRGGECPLQEQALADGPGESRFFEDKRRFIKALPLGPVLMLDRERCIICARCTRFGDLIAGDHALEFLDRGYRTEVGTPDGGPAKSKFIGNTIKICPVGALTSQVYRFRARPWDNDSTNSTCSLCPVGCSMILDARDGEIMRTRSRENHAVNDIWMCDKGWFGYEFTSSPERLQTPLIRRGETLEPASWEEAITLVASKIKGAKSNGKIAGFGGNPLTVEENYLFQQLIREGAGSNNLDHRIGTPIMSLDEEGISPGMEMSIGESEDLTFAYLLGLDLTEEFPVIWLRLKQAINRKAQVFFIGNYAPEISHHLAKTVVHAPGKELESIKIQLAQIPSGGKGAIFIGSQYLANPNRKALLAELLKLKKNSPHVSLNLLEGRGNSVGARWAGMRPDLGPLGVKLEKPGLNAIQVIEEAARGKWSYLHVAGADPALKFPSDLWRKARSNLDFLVVQDLFLTQTAQQADVVLPTLSYIEKGGSFLNIEGRVQKLLPGKEIPPNIYNDAQIFNQIAEKLSLILSYEDQFLKELENERISITKIENDQAVPNTIQPYKEGQLAAVFAHALFDHGVRMLHNPHTVQLAEEPRIRIHPLEGIKRNIESEGRVRISANGRSLIGKVKLDNRIAPGAVVLPLGFAEIPVQDLGVNLLNGMAVEIQKEV